MGELISRLLFWFIIANTLWYLIGSFIALDMNPMNWWLLNSTIGRIILIFIEFSLFGLAIKIVDEDY